MRITKVVLCLALLGGAMLPAQTATTPATPQIVPQAKDGIVTLDQLKNRLKQLQDGLLQAQANVNAFQGAIAETQNWIDTLGLKMRAPEVGDAKPGQPAK